MSFALSISILIILKVCVCVFPCERTPLQDALNILITCAQAASQHLFLGRDPLGRRSLLIHRPTPLQPHLLLSSATCGPSPGYDFEELSTEFLHYIDFSCFVDEACLSTIRRQNAETKARTPFVSPYDSLELPTTYCTMKISYSGHSVTSKSGITPRRRPKAHIIGRHTSTPLTSSRRSH